MKFSFCTLVNKEDQYRLFRDSAEMAGFAGPDCEFLFVDNRESNQYDAYSGLNHLISESKGDYIVCCHQDIVLEFDGCEVLEARLAELTALDPGWGVCGVAGVEGLHDYVRISDKFGEDRREGELPARVSSLDECFLILSRQAGLRFSSDIEGFHLYGTDICLVGEVLGHASYVIDFHLRHSGEGTKRSDFYASEKSFLRKWSAALRERTIRTSSTAVYLPGGHGPKFWSDLRGMVSKKWLKLKRHPHRSARRRQRRAAN